MAAFGINGGTPTGFKRLFMSHPPLEERIEALWRSAGQAGAWRGCGLAIEAPAAVTNPLRALQSRGPFMRESFAFPFTAASRRRDLQSTGALAR